jgi:hypothetical protein
LLFGGVYAPSTLREFLRAFSHGHVRQLQAVSREFLVQLARRTPLLPGAGAVTFIDVDSLLRRVYGKKKQGAAFGHAKVGGYQVLLRGLNSLAATISTPDAAPVIAATQLRAGNAGSARGAASLVAEAIATAKAVFAAQGATTTGEIVVRADSAFYARRVIAACRRAGVLFSVTMGMDVKVRKAIDAIPGPVRRSQFAAAPAANSSLGDSADGRVDIRRTHCRCACPRRPDLPMSARIYWIKSIDGHPWRIAHCVPVPSFVDQSLALRLLEVLATVSYSGHQSTKGSGWIGSGSWSAQSSVV